MANLCEKSGCQVVERSVARNQHFWTVCLFQDLQALLVRRTMCTQGRWAGAFQSEQGGGLNVGRRQGVSVLCHHQQIAL